MKPAAATAAILPLACGYFLSYLFRNANAVAAGDIMHDLGIGADALGLATSVYFLAFCAAQLPVGMLLDRYGPRRVQAGLLLCAAAGAAICAMDLGFSWLLVGRGLIGLGTSGSLAAGLKASAQWFARRHLAAVNAMLVACGGAGALAATWPADLLLGIAGWRGLSAMLAGMAALLALAIWRGVPDPAPAAASGPNPPGLRDVLADPVFRRFAPLSAACFGAVLALQGLWTAPWLADVDGLSRNEVTDDLAFMAVLLIVAAPCWGILVRRVERHMPLPRAAALACVVLLASEMLIAGRPRLAPGLPAALPWGVFALFGGITVLSFTLFAQHFPPALVGRANGLLNTLHIGCSFVVQAGIGLIVARWPMQAGHYPQAAYQAAMLLPAALQLAALAWFCWPAARPRPVSLSAPPPTPPLAWRAGMSAARRTGRSAP